MVLRLAIVVLLAGVVALATAAYRRRLARLHRPVAVPPIDRTLMNGAERTWVVFTTQYCATCGPVMDRIGTIDPDAHIVAVDVGDRPDLARRYAVRTAPTVLLAGADGEVRARLIGNVGSDALAASLA